MFKDEPSQTVFCPVGLLYLQHVAWISTVALVSTGALCKISPFKYAQIYLLNLLKLWTLQSTEQSAFSTVKSATGKCDS